MRLRWGDRRILGCRSPALPPRFPWTRKVVWAATRARLGKNRADGRSLCRDRCVEGPLGRAGSTDRRELRRGATAASTCWRFVALEAPGLAPYTCPLYSAPILPFTPPIPRLIS